MTLYKFLFSHFFFVQEYFLAPAHNKWFCLHPSFSNTLFPILLWYANSFLERKNESINNPTHAATNVIYDNTGGPREAAQALYKSLIINTRGFILSNP